MAFRFIRIGTFVALCSGVCSFSQANDIRTADVYNLGVHSDFSTSPFTLPAFFVNEGQISSNNLQTPQSFTSGTSDIHVSAIGKTMDTGTVASTGSTNIGLHLDNLTQTDFSVSNFSFAMSGVTFTADSITSHADIEGNIGDITGSTSLNLTNAVFTLNGKTIDLPDSVTRSTVGNDIVTVYSEPNMHIDYYDQIGQATYGGQTLYYSATGLGIYFTNYRLQDGSLAYGSIEIGRVETNLRDAAPEPSSLLALATLGGGLFLNGRKKLLRRKP